MPSYAKFDIWQNTAGLTQQVPIQIQYFEYAAQWSTTAHGGKGTGPASSGVDTPLSVTITPKLSTSKILVTAVGCPGYNSGSQVWLGSLKRSGNLVSTAYSPAFGGSEHKWSLALYSEQTSGSSGQSMLNFNIQWLDSPATTSTLTYVLRICGNNNTASAVGLNIAEIGDWGSWGGISTIVAMEIAQ